MKHLMETHFFHMTFIRHPSTLLWFYRQHVCFWISQKLFKIAQIKSVENVNHRCFIFHWFEMQRVQWNCWKSISFCLIFRKGYCYFFDVFFICAPICVYSEGCYNAMRFKLGIINKMNLNSNDYSRRA